ncbi:MauE/DoxX family redox-associated membrane protein [Pedobacter nyackensis]|uniref:Methylamine utilisation protein MauE domain-containing protein n=1 Tax=Pedobacter nyackensis TaxID=475255 RepID=A0A1W2DKP5_9SPHI|nr:MauE/DoxX family redox-associated membrane protein [Pedobacter nyackensis]SMC98074.1 hypothetical protein SAMN04488101_107135 [Pedobacter nyackensis]
METTINKRSRFHISDKTKRTIVDIIAYLYVLLFLYAATSKLIEYDKSLLQMSKSPIITDYAHILGWFVPTLEIIISMMLLIKRTILLGLYTAFTLMCLFTAYIYAILNYSDHIPCSCGGVLAQLGWNEHLIFNIAFIALALIGILLQAKIEEKKAK